MNPLVNLIPSSLPSAVEVKNEPGRSKEVQIYLKVQADSTQIPIEKFPQSMQKQIFRCSEKYSIKEHLFSKLLALSCENLKNAEKKYDFALIKSAIAHLLILNSFSTLPTKEENYRKSLLLKNVSHVYKQLSSELQQKKETKITQQLCADYLSLHDKKEVYFLDSHVSIKYTSKSSVQQFLKDIQKNLKTFASIYEFQKSFFNQVLPIIDDQSIEEYPELFFFQCKLNRYQEKFNGLHKKIACLFEFLNTVMNKNHVPFEDMLFLASEFDKISKNMQSKLYEKDNSLVLFASINPFVDFTGLKVNNSMTAKFNEIYQSLLKSAPKLIKDKEKALNQFYNSYFVKLGHQFALQNSINFLFHQIQQVTTLSAIENNIELNTKVAINSLKIFKEMSISLKKAQLERYIVTSYKNEILQFFDHYISQIHATITTWMKNPSNNYAGLLFGQCSWLQINIKHSLKDQLEYELKNIIDFKTKLDARSRHHDSELYQLALDEQYITSTDRLLSFEKVYNELCTPTVEKINHFFENFLYQKEVPRRDHSIETIDLEHKEPIESTIKEIPIQEEHKIEKPLPENVIKEPQIDREGKNEKLALKVKKNKTKKSYIKKIQVSKPESQVKKDENKVQSDLDQNSKEFKPKKVKESQRNRKFDALLREAYKQGWGIAREKGGHVQLQKIDCPEAGTATLPRHSTALKPKTLDRYRKQLAEGNRRAKEIEEIQTKEPVNQTAPKHKKSRKHKNKRKKM